MELKWKLLELEWKSYVNGIEIFSCAWPSSSMNDSLHLSHLFTRGQFGPSGIFVACVCVCLYVCLCVNHLLVRAITRDPFKLGSPNLHQRCKRPWLRSLLFCELIDLDLQGQIELESSNLPHFELVCAITHHLFKLGSPNLDQRCKIPWLRYLLLISLLVLTFNVKYHLKSQIFRYYPTGNTQPPYNHQRAMSTKTVSWAWLFHSLHPLNVLICLDCFAVPTVSQSQHVAHILI